MATDPKTSAFNVFQDVIGDILGHMPLQSPTNSSTTQSNCVDKTCLQMDAAMDQNETEQRGINNQSPDSLDTAPVKAEKEQTTTGSDNFSTFGCLHSLEYEHSQKSTPLLSLTQESIANLCEESSSSLHYEDLEDAQTERDSLEKEENPRNTERKVKENGTTLKPTKSVSVKTCRSTFPRPFGYYGITQRIDLNGDYGDGEGRKKETFRFPKAKEAILAFRQAKKELEKNSKPAGCGTKSPSVQKAEAAVNNFRQVEKTEEGHSASEPVDDSPEVPGVLNKQFFTPNTLAMYRVGSNGVIFSSQDDAPKSASVLASPPEEMVNIGSSNDDSSASASNRLPQGSNSNRNKYVEVKPPCLTEAAVDVEEHRSKYVSENLHTPHSPPLATMMYWPKQSQPSLRKAPVHPLNETQAREQYKSVIRKAAKGMKNRSDSTKTMRRSRSLDKGESSKKRKESNRLEKHNRRCRSTEMSSKASASTPAKSLPQVAEMECLLRSNKQAYANQGRPSGSSKMSKSDSLAKSTAQVGSQSPEQDDCKSAWIRQLVEETAAELSKVEEAHQSTLKHLEKTLRKNEADDDITRTILHLGQCLEKKYISFHPDQNLLQHWKQHEEASRTMQSRLKQYETTEIFSVLTNHSKNSA